MEKFSNFSQVMLAIAAIGLMPLCISASKHWAQGYVVLVVLSLFAAFVIISRKWAESRRKTKEEFPHDGLEGLFKSFVMMAISGVGFFLVVGVTIFLTLPFWKETSLLIMNNLSSLTLTSLITAGIVITIWRIRAENKK